MNGGRKEKRFLDELEALFTGAEVDGKHSGFVNLMWIKQHYFQSIKPQLMAAIDQRAKPQTAFREELFDKLYTFFRRYFCESGSIYFRHLPAFSKTYQQVYADGQDVALSWKTQMLYYVKSDALVRSMPVELNEEGKPQKTRRFYFDASEVEHKQNNERREFVFDFDEVKKTAEGRVIHLKVAYARGGTKTKTAAILKEARRGGISLTDDQLQKALGVFRRQTEVDYFINKDAKGFLREQFDLWMYQYLFQEETVFEQKRIKQLQALKETAYDIIHFIAQFEDELRRAWEKPKFVRNVNYVVTLDKLNAETLQKVRQHKGARTQIKEWRELGMVDDQFSMDALGAGQQNLADTNGGANGDYKFLPLDTGYFKDMKLEILAALGNLDEALDGELVHSENWQALNTLRERYRGKVKCIYIDPPYNTDSSAILYRNDYKDSSWLSLVENRLTISKAFLGSEGIICCAIDDEESWRLFDLLQRVFDRKLGVVPVRTNPAGRKSTGQFSPSHEYALFFGNKDAVPSSLPKTDKERARYPFADSQGRYAWNNLIRHGSNDKREDAPKMFYPIYVKEDDTIRIPELEWREDNREYRVQEKPNSDEVVLWPIRGEIEKNWHRGWERVQSEPDEYRIRRGKNGSISIDFRIRMDESAMPKTWWDDNKYASSNHGAKVLKDLFGESLFNFPKSVALVEDCLTTSGCNKRNAVAVDYFAGSGTTAHAVINLNREDGGNRKYLMIEMGDYFDTVLLPRIKKVVYSKDWKNGKPVSREGVSHCLKYYKLEQYEETLKEARYDSGRRVTSLELDSTKSPFEQYVFFGDDKLAGAVKPLKNGKLKINLHDLYRDYQDIDIAETLSNALGKPIRRRTADSVTFADGTTEKTDPATMTEEEKRHFISLIKSYLWWGE